MNPPARPRAREKRPLWRDGAALLPLAVAEADDAMPLEDRALGEAYRGALVLLRRRGVPRGLALVPTPGGRLAAAALRAAARGVADPPPLAPVVWPAAPPALTLAVCTRGRPESLRRCLNALRRLDPPPPGAPSLDRLVVDNAPPDGQTERLVREAFPEFRYTCEPLPGLDRARNRALAEARGDWVAFTDDDTEPDAGWARALAAAVAATPGARAVTGLTLPAALDTPAQLAFEVHGSFARGFRVRTFRRDRRLWHLSPGIFGAGANMALERAFARAIGGFDPALDVGTPTGGGGDIEMFLRVVEEGGALVYDPRALVWHHHREHIEDVYGQFAGWGAYYAVMCRTAAAYPHLRWPVLRRSAWWFTRRMLARPVLYALRGRPVPWRLYRAELGGALYGLTSYARAQKAAARLDAARLDDRAS